MVGHVSASFRQWLYWHKSEKVEYISYFLGNHGNDCCFYERLNSLYRPTPATRGWCWYRVTQLLFVIAVNVKTFEDEEVRRTLRLVIRSCSLFFPRLNHSSPVTVTTLTAMIWVRIAHKTPASTAHLSFIRGWPKPARKYRGMRFPWPPGMLSHRMHKSQSALQH